MKAEIFAARTQLQEFTDHALRVLVALVPAANAAQACTTATIAGNYGFTFTGFVKDHGRTIPFAGTGITTADGGRQCLRYVIASVDGKLSTFPYTASYTVNRDCTGSVISTSGGANFFHRDCSGRGRDPGSRY